MKHLKSTVLIAAAALGLLAANAMAGGRPDPYATKPIESPFKGVVNNIGPTSVTVRGEVQLAHPDASNPGGKSKPIHQNFNFSIRGAKLTRDGKPCELKDVQKGDAVSVTFTTKKDSDKRVVTQIDCGKGAGEAAEEKPKGGEKKTKEKKK